MGAVYRARDSADGSTVAIKVLHPDEARRPRARRRFAKEARLLAEVNNPYVTNLVEVNEDGGVHYLVLEFVAGTSLARWLGRRGRLDEPTALAIMADVARALDFAHGRGIVHRDVKPENILMVGPGLAAAPHDRLDGGDAPRAGAARGFDRHRGPHARRPGVDRGAPLDRSHDRGDRRSRDRERTPARLCRGDCG